MSKPSQKKTEPTPPAPQNQPAGQQVIPLFVRAFLQHFECGVTDDGQLLVMAGHTPAGRVEMLLPFAEVDKVMETINNTVTQYKTGLTVAKPGIVVPGPQGMN